MFAAAHRAKTWAIGLLSLNHDSKRTDRRCQVAHPNAGVLFSPSHWRPVWPESPAPKFDDIGSLVSPRHVEEGWWRNAKDAVPPTWTCAKFRGVEAASNKSSRCQSPSSGSIRPELVQSVLPSRPSLECWLFQTFSATPRIRTAFPMGSPGFPEMGFATNTV